MSSDTTQAFQAAAEGFFERAWTLINPHIGASPALAVRLTLMEELAGAREDSTELDAVMPHAAVDPSTTCLCLGLLGRRAFLRRDAASLLRIFEEQEKLAEDRLSPDAVIALRCGMTWNALLRGDASAIDVGALASLEREAVLLADAHHVIECALLRAWTLLELEHEDATRAVRRAARMAQTEGLPQQQYIAHLLLARLRRTQQRPHLALRILGSLQKVAPPAWSPWLAWESELAGRATGAGVSDFVLACQDTDESRVQVAFAAALESAGQLSVFRADVLALRDALFAAGECASQASVEWREGRRPHAPRGVQGAALVSSSKEDVLAYVAAPPQGAGKRVLFQGLGQIDTEGWRQLPQSQRKRGRMETAAAALALAGEAGLEEERLFESVYGFVQEEGVHDGVLDVVLHRLRAWLDAHGSVQREKKTVRLRHQGLVIPDPRCAVPLDDRVLALLAESPASAGDLAVGLDLPLRTVQRMLKRLTAEQSCVKEREGRAVVYRVEDTTFQEPTRV